MPSSAIGNSAYQPPLPPLEVFRGKERVTTFALCRCEGYRGPPGAGAASATPE